MVTLSGYSVFADIIKDLRMTVLDLKCPSQKRHRDTGAQEDHVKMEPEDGVMLPSPGAPGARIHKLWNPILKQALAELASAWALKNRDLGRVRSAPALSLGCRGFAELCPFHSCD